MKNKKIKWGNWYNEIKLNSTQYMSLQKWKRLILKQQILSKIKNRNKYLHSEYWKIKIGKLMNISQLNFITIEKKVKK